MKNIFTVYKPSGPTSTDILNQIKRITRVKKVGHAGTLDPLAKGILVVGLGREATKQLSQAVAKEKEYLATIKLGESSTTDDAEGEKIKIVVEPIPAPDKVKSVLLKFQGEIRQTPPIYSAIKIKGQEAYKYARQGKSVALKPRKAFVKEIELLNYYWPELKIRVVTGPGVYIRSLARDIGNELQVAAI